MTITLPASNTIEIKLYVARIQSCDSRDFNDVCIYGTPEEARACYRGVLIKEMTDEVAEADFDNHEDAAKAHLEALSDHDLSARYEAVSRDLYADWGPYTIDVPRPEAAEMAIHRMSGMKLFHFTGHSAGHGELDVFDRYVRAENAEQAFRLVNESWGWDEEREGEDPHEIAQTSVEANFGLKLIKEYPEPAPKAEALGPADIEAILHGAL